METQRAKDIINLQQREESQQAVFRQLWQKTADYIYPMANQIEIEEFPGTPRTEKIYDITAITDSMEMAAGLSQALVPPGQQFFELGTIDQSDYENDQNKRHLSLATEIAHEELVQSNFILALNEALRSWVVFGLMNTYSEYTGTELNFKNYRVGIYQFLENNKGQIDTMIVKFPYTADQAVSEWGEENVGPCVQEAYKEEKTRQKKFWFIHIVRPRSKRNPNLKDSMNMKFESIYINVKDKWEISEGGFNSFPYHTARWLKAENEKYGRGQGTENIPQVRVLNRMVKDLIECSNKWNNPPMEVLESFEGEVDVSPNALNYVSQIGSIKALDEGVRGNFPVSDKIVEMQRDVVHKVFFKDVFAPLTELTGDRRTTLEIRQRIQEGLRRLGPPIGRLWSEYFDTLITRCILLLYENGKIPAPPEGLQGKPFKIEYKGAMANALKNTQARGVQQWMEFLVLLSEQVPNALDNVDVDSAVRRIGQSLGVAIEDIASEDEVAAKRQARAQMQQQQQELEMLQAGAASYNQTSGAPEKGSPAGKLMEAAGV